MLENSMSSAIRRMVDAEMATCPTQRATSNPTKMIRLDVVTTTAS